MRNCEANQSNLNLCSYRRYKQLDERLNALYQIQLKRLRGSEQEKPFIEAERAWLKYINADCLYQNGPREESGTIWPLLRTTACQTICSNGSTCCNPSSIARRMDVSASEVSVGCNPHPHRFRP